MYRDSKGRFTKAAGFTLERHQAPDLADQVLAWMDANGDTVFAISVMLLVHAAAIIALANIAPIR